MITKVPGAPPPYTSVLKPKPILVDKQASEPNTPTNKYFERPMTRGNSDVSQRMKKRVTLSSLPSRHSLEAKEPDLLQVPQVVQIEHAGAPYIEEDCDPRNQGRSYHVVIYYTNRFICVPGFCWNTHSGNEILYGDYRIHQK
ncbi:hypothetical protein E2C01_020123 [Portunus trituberculatus]|uniref:Uncharacterized protein n=1 Tax=Portunus trituberculatus TaxID=210409 RepID=A0A5B7DZ54_PORTR|nr:hypothetical protein [Portunus trituberculatus]